MYVFVCIEEFLYIFEYSDEMLCDDWWNRKSVFLKCVVYKNKDRELKNAS